MSVNTENELLTELSRTIEHAKQRTALTLKKLHADKRVETSLNDLNIINTELTMALSQVYKDLAPTFQRLKESIKKEKKLLEETNTKVIVAKRLDK